MDIVENDKVRYDRGAATVSLWYHREWKRNLES